MGSAGGRRRGDAQGVSGLSGCITQPETGEHPVQERTIDLTDIVEQERVTRAAAVRSTFEDTMGWLTTGGVEQPLHRMERELHERLMRLGLLMVALWLASRLPTRVKGALRKGRGWYAFEDLATAVVRCRYGKLRHLQPTYTLVHGKGSAVLSPFGRLIGLTAGRMSLGVHLMAAYLATKLVFDDSLDVMGLSGGYVPSKRAALGIVDQLGPKASRYLDDMPPPLDDGEILFIQVDGKGAPHIHPDEHERRCKPHTKRPRGQSQRERRRWRRRQKQTVRRKKGDKSKNARMATVGVVYTLRRLPDGTIEGPIHKRVIGTFEGSRVLFRRLAKEARKRGYGTKETVFLADGATHLWTMWKEFFPKATPCLDWYHLCEYLWKAGGTVHKEGADALVAWVRERKEELRSGDVDATLAAMEELRHHIGRSGPGTKGRRERLAKAIGYVENHRDYLNYEELLARDLDIATGAIEGAVKHVVGARLDGSGMRWCVQRAEHVLSLRCVVVNGDWDAFCEATMLRHEALQTWTIPRITPDGPMKPYEAKKKAA